MITRRELILALGAAGALAALPVDAQQPPRMRRIGFASATTAQATAGFLTAFRDGMRALGWVEGRDYAIDVRYANGVAGALEKDAVELVASQPDLLLATSDETAHVYLQRTKAIPIVFALATDPVGNGIAASLRHPGGNSTGLTNLSTDIGAKRLQLLKEAFPRVTHVAQLFEPDNHGSLAQVKPVQDAARRLRIRVTPIELRKVEDLEAAFKRGAAIGAQAYLVVQGPLVNTLRQSIVDRLMRAKVPAMFSASPNVEAGGLMSYGTSLPDNFRRAAGYVDKIFKGAKPGDLPIEQPVKFEMIVNMKTAKIMGLTIPQSILLRADQMIE